MPPESALRRVVQLVDFQLQYLITAGDSGAKLPDFLSRECLKRTENGDIEYDFGPDAHVLSVLDVQSEKRQSDHTPQKGRRKKRMLTSTPTKK